MNSAAVNAANRRAARLGSTMVIVAGALITALILPSEDAEGVFSVAAYGVGLALATAMFIELRNGIRSLIRVDLLLLFALYGLTLTEFLFGQPTVNRMVSPELAQNGAYAVLVGFAGLAMGRLFVPIHDAASSFEAGELNAPSVFFIFVVLAFLGYLHIFLAVNFDVFEAVRQMLLPRFSQAWSRGMYGDAAALLHEVGALINLIPPMSGLIFANARQYSMAQKVLVIIVLGFTAFYGFSSGTRNVFVTYILTFAGVYLITKPQLTKRHALIFGSAMVVLLLVGITLMLQFRTVGLGSLASTAPSEAFYVDLNIVNIAQLTAKFPDVYGYLGLEIPINALIRPIPRVLWADKPTGLSVSIEGALGAEGLTLSCTYVGEAYMAGGLVAVLIASLIFGAAAEMWNRVGFNSSRPFMKIVYVSGFLCAAVSMRSMLSMFPLMLPTIALWLVGNLWLTGEPPTTSPSTLGRRDR
jgi:oligosaccharide repeat unit polymerase